ncbi:MAG: carboxypeptidase-like regulatory domain-containing protein, partial [Pyrinomonadaceae bacterium]
MKNIKTLFLSIFCILIGTFAAMSQATATSELRGNVTDQNGAAVSGATVTATDTAKGTTRTVTTNADGNYVLLSLSPSTYSVKVAASGFSSKTSNNVLIEVGQQLSLDVGLSVGNVDAVVDVAQGDEPLVDTERTQQSSV